MGMPSVLKWTVVAGVAIRSWSEGRYTIGVGEVSQFGRRITVPAVNSTSNPEICEVEEFVQSSVFPVDAFVFAASRNDRICSTSFPKFCVFVRFPYHASEAPESNRIMVTTTIISMRVKLFFTIRSHAVSTLEPSSTTRCSRIRTAGGLEIGT